LKLYNAIARRSAKAGEACCSMYAEAGVRKN
jgi:hypothetical protein